ncbi:MAG: efflux RND transporter periplasmic adaptor subunit [Gammaproteobacteria bacterium]|nr:efflux RND transporter periplasmic adaptor subunit [Gammaproteobacteria bacterium]
MILFLSSVTFNITSLNQILFTSVYAGEDDHDEEAATEAIIQADVAKRAGIFTEHVSSQTIKQSKVLTGRMMQVPDNTFTIRARFPGIVKSVKVQWGESVKKGQVLALIESNDSLRTYSVKAPNEGVVIERNTNMGDVANDNALFKIADLSTLWAEFNVFPSDLHSIKAQQNIIIQHLDSNLSTQSKIKMLLPVADAVSQTVTAIVPISNKDSLWRPGMIIEGYVHVQEKLAHLAIKESALQNMGEKSVVFVKENESMFVPHEVTLGERDGEFIEVLSGLSEGDEYVSQGSFRIKADLLKSTLEDDH